MANSTYGKVWVADTIGIITRKPIWVRKVVMIPNAHSDAATFYYWDKSDTIATGCSESGGINGDITTNNTLTMDSGSLLPAAITDGSIFEFTHSNGSALNLNKPMVIKTAGNNTVVVIHKIPAADQWTNEINKHYVWKTYQNRLAFRLLSQATYAKQEVLDFGPNGFRFPNLALETITTEGSTKVYIYER